MLAVAALAVNTDDLEAYYERSDVDWSRYDKVLLDPLSLSRAKIIPPVWVEGKDRLPRRWALSKGDIKLIKASYYEVMQQQIQQDGGYAIVTEPAEGAMEMSIAIVSLTPYALPEEKVITRGTGELTMQIQIRDAMTRELLAIYEGDRAVGKEYQEHTRLTAKHNVNQLFATWGKLVRESMDEAHGK
jgi:hypothetical protein